MATYITRKDIKHGDKIEVTWLSKGIENTRVGVAHEKRGDVWLTKEGGSLGTSGEMKISIKLLGRLTKEQRRQNRREELLVEFLGAHVAWGYVAPAMAKAIERIIFLEDEKEALVN